MSATYSTSEQTNELAAALANLQSRAGGCKKSGLNPHFKSRYSTLADVWEVIRPHLGGLGLAVAQFPLANEHAAGAVTVVMHSSGQRASCELLLPLGGKATPQSIGSAISYAKRYTLTAVCGVADDDDDGHAATESARESRHSGAGRTNASRGDIAPTEAKKTQPRPPQRESANVSKRGDFSKTGCMGCGGLVGPKLCPGPAAECRKDATPPEVERIASAMRKLGRVEDADKFLRWSRGKAGEILAKGVEQAESQVHAACNHVHVEALSTGFVQCTRCGLDLPEEFPPESMSDAMGLIETEVPF